MRTPKSRIAAVGILALALAFAVVLPAVATNHNGRSPDAKPGPATREGATETPTPYNGWDGDGPAPRTLVHSGDSTIQGGLCVGFDCSANEPMGFATIKIEENNLRIAAADSSTVSGFPTTDWQIEFNSSSSGGGNYFMVRDCGTSGAAASVDSTCGGVAQLTIEGGADNESIHVDSSGNQGGNVGFGTANPVVDLHALSGNTPTLRLEQDNSSGFTPQSWDMAGNESNFFIRDVTNGSALPFRIEPGTASNTLYIDNNERIGIGTTAPQDSLHIRETGGTDRALIRLERNGNVGFAFQDTSAGTEWSFGTTNVTSNFSVALTGSGNLLTLEQDGDLIITGNLTANGTLYPSDRAVKRAFGAVNHRAILDAVAALDIKTWKYKNDAEGATHIGPTAQDFHAAFGYGGSDTTISAVDVNGVALAAIKALATENAELRSRVEALEAALNQG